MFPDKYTEPYSIRIPFAVEAGQEGDILERVDFWDSPSTAQWSKARGYILYQRIGESSWTRPTIHPEVACDEAHYPYAYYDLGDPDSPASMSDPLIVWESSGKIMFAQDSLNRHVAIKIVRADSDEYRILRFLNQQNMETLKANCIMPVLDLLPAEEYWFAVMPRWGHGIDQPYMQAVHEVVTMIHSMLKGLAYLHEHNIVHRDIATKNMLVNHFSGSLSYLYNETRRNLRSRKRLSYAILDFDFSVILSPEADINTFRLPYYESWGTFDNIKDTDAGESDFNPFIFDVGVMGSLLCHEFQHMSRALPMLAPLLDNMTTWDLAHRFTASEALRFFEERLSEVTDDQLEQYICDEPYKQPYDEYDRWLGLSPDFVEKWKAYRVPPLPWHMRFLRRLCQIRISSLPSQLFRRIIPSKIAI